ncbi:MAG: transketolase C-terminal domain-containing protein [Microgenomates group bacterium]|nr:transketolase C-terminal domain-containing protein [Microgenomates group bacterium]
MRSKFVDILTPIAKKKKKIIFMTADLGFNALEKLATAIDERFINAGVAEQNMMTVAAGLASLGFQVWVYSIAPFVTIKTLEEIKLDICLENLDVKIVGIGGGFDYEVAGVTHHATEDVGTLLTLPNMKIYTPAFAEDLFFVVKKMVDNRGPAYLRLTKLRKMVLNFAGYGNSRRLLKGKKITLVALGSIIDQAAEAGLKLNQEKNNTDLWVISELPIKLPKELINSLNQTKHLAVVEEHVLAGGLGQYLSQIILTNRISIKNFTHFYIKDNLSNKTGSRDYYLKKNGLDSKTIIKKLSQFI